MATAGWPATQGNRYAWHRLVMVMAILLRMFLCATAVRFPHYLPPGTPEEQLELVREHKPIPKEAWSDPVASSRGGSNIDRTQSSGGHPAAKRPNIIFVLTDDQELVSGGSNYQPKTQEHLVDNGVNFTNFYVNFALCCPSRATFLTGKCTHNHGVPFLFEPLGGDPRFQALGLEKETIAYWLQKAGYRTGLIGKYLNSYTNASHIPLGWERWFSFLEHMNYYNHTVSDQGKAVFYGDKPEDHSTDLITGKALDFLDQAVSDERPFFLWLAPHAPHQPAIPAPRHIGKLKGIKVPRTPSFNEGEESQLTKVTSLRLYPRFPPAVEDALDFVYQTRAESLLAVDEQVDAVVKKLQEIGELDNTYIFYSSDNGWHLGQHRLLGGKTTPYEEDVHLPLYIRGPGVPKNLVVPHLVGNIDLVPTWAELTGISKPHKTAWDGISLVPLLRAPGVDAQGEWAVKPDDFRIGFLFEKLQSIFDFYHISPSVVVQDPENDIFDKFRVTWGQEAAFQQKLIEFINKAEYTPADPAWVAKWKAFDNRTGPSTFHIRDAKIPIPDSAAIFPDSNYDIDIVNKGADFAPDGGLTISPFTVTEGAGTQGHNYAEKYYEGNVLDWYAAVGYLFPTSYYGVRLSHSEVGELTYFEFPEGRELYNLTSDPHQLWNIFDSAPAPLVADLQSVLETLKYCRGPTCDIKGSSLVKRGSQLFLKNKARAEDTTTSAV